MKRGSKKTNYKQLKGVFGNFSHKANVSVWTLQQREASENFLTRFLSRLAGNRHQK